MKGGLRDAIPKIRAMYDSYKVLGKELNNETKMP